MQRVSIVIFLALCWIGAATLIAATAVGAAPSERLVMPFSCGFEGNRLALQPSADRSYAIIGLREQRPFAFCREPLPSLQPKCRTVMVHRFAISCAGVRVPWARVVAAALAPSGGRIAYANGRLKIERTVKPSAGDARPCIDRPSRVGGPPPGAENQDCLPWRPARVVEKLEPPEGFAPVVEIGARFVFSADAAPDHTASLVLTAADGATGIDAVHAAHELRQTRGAGAVTVEALPGAAENPSRPATAESVLDWIPVVEARDLSEAAAETVPERIASMLAWLLLAGVLVGTIWAAHRRLAGARAGAGVARTFGPWLRFAEKIAEAAAAPFARNPGTGASYDPSLANAADQVAALLKQTQFAVFGLRSATPLRDVLEEEVHGIGQRLAIAKAAAIDGKGSVTKTAGQFRALVRELDRVRRIASSAAPSLTNLREAVTLPQTKSEAYEVLGVNADVSEGILKKIVDALRMTWHPDHAKDEEDRLLREQRIKQINIAWELINDKRHAA
ncbi:MAG TPA: J domain-containing protein [Hyphomicrobiaceae bacterium]|nr:J domain-containing protein [Hyphomicrobiaceae bacterium]